MISNCISELQADCDWGKAITKVKGHKPELYEAQWVIAGTVFNFTILKIRGLNKPFKPWKPLMNELLVILTQKKISTFFLRQSHYGQKTKSGYQQFFWW